MKMISMIVFLAIGSSSQAQGSWMQKADLPAVERAGAVGFSIGTKGYIGTGNATGTVTGPQKDFWEWDQASDVWTQKADFGGIARYDAVGFSIGSKGYIGLGYDMTPPISILDYWEWDPATNTWTKKLDFPGPARSYAVGYSIGAKGYIGTGYTGGGQLKDFWEWDQVTDTWLQKADVPGLDRYAAVGFSIGSKGYIGIGFNGFASPPAQKDFYEYDPVTDTWTQKPDFPDLPREGAIGFSIGINGYIGLGYDTTAAKDFWKWDQVTEAWTWLGDFSGSARTSPVGFSIGAKGYVGCGFYLKDFWEYDPNGSGVHEIDLSNLISVYPNPSNGTINVQMSSLENIQMKSVQVYNVQGERIHQSVNRPASTSSNFQIDISSQPNGIYFLHLETEQGTATKKIIIQ